MARSMWNVWASASSSAFALSAVLSCPLLCSEALAQSVPTGSTPPENVSAMGIRAGNVEIHPEVSARGGYDTNVFKADGEGDLPQSRIKSAGIILVTPGISFNSLSSKRAAAGEDAASGDLRPPKLEMKAAAFATFYQYLGLEDQATGSELNLRGAEFDVSGDFHVLPKRPVSLLLGGSWTRNARPFTAVSGSLSDDGDGVKERKVVRKAQAFNTIVPRARLMFESRGGVLTAYAGYRPTIQPFEGEALKYLSSATHEVDVGMGWRFFPSTALLYDMTFTLVDYYKVDDIPVAQQQVLLSGSKRARARLGVNGAFTKRLSLRVLAGYAAGVFDNDFLSEFEEPVGEAVLSYRFGAENKSLAEAGYMRTVSPAAVGGYNISDRGFARLTFLLLGTLGLKAEVGVGKVQFGKQLAPIFGANDEIVGARALEADGVTTKREDVRIDAALRAEYKFISWLGVLGEFVYQQNITDFRYGNITTPDPAEYQVFQVNAGLRASY